MASAGRLSAQDPGDVYWQFVPNGLMADERIEAALTLLIDAETVADDAGVAGSLLYGDPRTAEFVARLDADEAELLLMAAGVGVPAQGVVQARPCRFWTPPEGELMQTRNDVGVALGEALAKALSDIGIEADPCAATPDQEGADVLIWESGQDFSIPDGLYFPDADSFLALEFELSGGAPGGSSGNQGVAPPATGDGGLR